MYALEVEVTATHIDDRLLEGQRPGHVDAVRCDLLIMKFTEFFGEGRNLHSSRLADGFGLDHGLGATA